MTRCETSRLGVIPCLASNVARLRQNVRRDLKKMEEESRAVEQALGVVRLFLGTMFCYSKIIIFMVPL